MVESTVMGLGTPDIAALIVWAARMSQVRAGQLAAVCVAQWEPFDTRIW